jgi:uncharacterized protein YaiL (DUF2058 family)
MSNMRDQLKKAKLLSKKQAKKLAHDERIERKELGREGLEKIQTERKEQLGSLRESEREKSREQQAKVEAEKQAAAEQAACLHVLSEKALAPEPGGQNRWFFALENGSLPSLALNEQQRRLLQSGALSIARSGPVGSHRYGLLERALAARVAKVFPERIVWGL